MENLKSLSQGCFVSAPQKSKSSRGFDGIKSVMGERHRLYQETWTHLEKEISKCQSDANMEALDAVVEYVQSNNPSLREARTRVEIPTAALIMGVNMSDHPAVLKLLTSKLYARATRMIATVRVADSGTISAMFQKVVMSIIEAAGSEDALVTKRNSCMMQMLASWYASAVTKVTLHYCCRIY